jgi:hypothetical protein
MRPTLSVNPISFDSVHHHCRTAPLLQAEIFLRVCSLPQAQLSGSRWNTGFQSASRRGRGYRNRMDEIAPAYFSRIKIAKGFKKLE